MQLKGWAKHHSTDGSNSFPDGQEQVKDEDRSRALERASTAGNVKEVHTLVIKDHCSTMKVISEATDISKGTVNTILYDDLKLHKVCSKFVPPLWGPDAPCHKSMLVTAWMAKRGMKLIKHPHYSPDLAPCDLFLFPCMKVCMRGYPVQQEKEEELSKYLKGLQQKK